ncbi:hypothetical protein K431DRAFT_291599 [Polychaeton citri CBS 116435]|uniref:GST N-terminal domain-containing protein n=1 Tax=Polychaeton citri CBS 116435 TaxID=1314669 RepID=A0A9P4QGV1_9PEZI|nr:hypothetical protein K431DRAFT_291599 [Polychaeton citri CBS 116435]
MSVGNSSTDEITLYDLKSRGRCACWSPNVWKARLALNYKNIPYKTHWLEHQTIAPTLEPLGIPPNKGPYVSPHTVPTIHIPSPEDSYMMDSQAIATYLDETHPSPPLRLTDPSYASTTLAPISSLLARAAIPLFPVFMPRIGRDVIVESSSEYFHENQAKRFGMPMAQLEAARGGDAAWEAAKPAIEALGALVQQGGGGKGEAESGPFVLGAEVSYADFVIAAFLESLRRIGPDMYEKAIGYDGTGALERLHGACKPWMGKDQ